MVQRPLACTFRLLVEDMGWIRSVEVSGNLVVLLATLHCQQLFIDTYMQITRQWQQTVTLARQQS